MTVRRKVNMKTHKKGRQPKVNNQQGRANRRQGDPRYKRLVVQAQRDGRRGWFATLDELPGALGEARTLPGALRDLAAVLEEQRLFHGGAAGAVEQAVDAHEASAVGRLR